MSTSTTRLPDSPESQPARPRLLSILIPAFNEERTIREVLSRVLAVDTEAIGFAKEVVVCDDGSSDATADMARWAALADARVCVIQHPRNLGKGAAIRTALAVAEGDVCIVQDADLEYDPEDYPRLLEAVAAGARVVYGSRFLRRAWPEGMAAPNYVANRLLTITSNLLFGSRITDEATCLKVFDTELLRSLALRCEGFEFCPEVTAKLGKRRVPITEVPIAYRGRTAEEGKKINWRDGVTAFWTLVRLRLSR
ncbi:MAG TPA: glycosyltransferase family 2 protein [Kofleriaceae bacterium]|nr:glycosyltransferase family 2 protein [Kofleriaceae bacterium]